MQTETLIKKLLENFGENPFREGLLETPKRVEKMYGELLSGYGKDPKDVFKYFDSENYKGTIKVGSINFSSLCEHHMLPFFGTVDLVYRPNGKVVGLSKFSRLVDIYSKRLQLQERLTRQIAESIMEHLKPVGCTVTVKAEHLCMSIRGVNKPGAITETCCTLGNL